MKSGPDTELLQKSSSIRLSPYEPPFFVSGSSKHIESRSWLRRLEPGVGSVFEGDARASLTRQFGAPSPRWRGMVATGLDSGKIPRGPDNLTLRVARRVSELRKRELPAFVLTMENEIPLARGLGSSAAAIIAGITSYELATEDRLSEAEIFRYAFEFEPHPDNLAAALRGGMVAAATADNGEVLISKLAVPDGLQPIVVIPEFELSTEKARGVLPQTYSRKDAVYNIQRSALMISAMTTGDWPLLREAMRDRIHQPYRAPLIPGFEEILKLQMDGLLGIALSGAGPTVLALATPEGAEDVGNAIAEVFSKHGVKATPHLVNIDNVGRLIERP